ncbi:MAG TPA: hypothetical protein VGW80_11070 [Solirubrobacterales bacterium]|jgi:hypothetical protein|nr:hypothetical protein [Solirubrobacterales bacterium]
MASARYVWHPELHWQAGERLFFVRLYFEPVYPDVQKVLLDRLERLEISSYHVYELVGAFDLMLRVWYPGNVTDLIAGLDLPEVRRADYMEVRKIHEHWVHAEGQPGPSPELTDLTSELVTRINQESHKVDGEDLRNYVRAGLIAPVSEQQGVKFFIAVMASIGNSASINFTDVLVDHVSGILDDAADIVEGRSIYAGDGFARLLLMGRFPGHAYFDFMERVILQLNNKYMRQLFSARTSTGFGATRNPLLGQDLLSPKKVAAAHEEELPLDGEKDAAAEDLDVLLEEGENQYVEVKASAFLNLDRLVHQSMPSWDDLRPELVKAVCGLLNQRNGERATLIIGAVETHRYRKWLNENRQSLAEIGEFTILGLEEDNPSGDWDLYQRRLADSLNAAIEPSPLPYMTLALERHIHGETVKKVMRIILTPSGRPFYDRDGQKLWVRQGAQVKELRGREHDEFVQSMAGAHA